MRTVRKPKLLRGGLDDPRSVPKISLNDIVMMQRLAAAFSRFGLQQAFAAEPILDCSIMYTSHRMDPSRAFV